MSLWAQVRTHGSEAEGRGFESRGRKIETALMGLKPLGSLPKHVCQPKSG
jgi:hypothetical protein